MAFEIRRAVPCDIDRLMEIRGAVQENRLSDPLSVTRADYDRFVAYGRVWVGCLQAELAGFSASDERDGTIWALFVDPASRGMGLGPALLEKACLDLKRDGYQLAKLTTEPGTIAERLYRRLGWVDLGMTTDGERVFELSL